MLKKIHVLYTIPNFDTAGSGKVVYDLANQLDKKRFEVSIACNHSRGAFFEEVEKLGLNIYFINVTVPLRPYHNLMQRTKPFRTFLKEKHIDLVHSWHWSSDWSEVLACRMVGVAFVYTKKSMGWGNVHWKIRSYLSNFIVTVNTEMHDFFPNKKQQRLIPFGLDLDYYSSGNFPIHTPTQQFKLITVANLVEVKGIETLLKALAELRHLSLFLEIVGDTRDPYALTLKKMVGDLNLGDNVRFLGKLKDVRPLLAAADLYIIPSKNEGLPMALVEAMAMSLPVLGSDISGISYVLQNFRTLLFPIEDFKALGEKIEIMYAKSAEERQQLGDELREECKSRFTIPSFIEAHENLYLEILNPTDK